MYGRTRKDLPVRPYTPYMWFCIFFWETWTGCCACCLVVCFFYFYFLLFYNIFWGWCIREGGGYRQENSQQKFPRPYVRTYRTLHFYFYFGKRGHSTTQTKTLSTFLRKKCRIDGTGCTGVRKKQKIYFGTLLRPYTPYTSFLFLFWKTRTLLNYIYPCPRFSK